MRLSLIRIDELASMKYGKMPKSEILSEEGYPIFSGYRVTGFAKEYLYSEPKLIIVARGVGGTGDVKISPPNSWITNLSIVLELDETKVDKKYLLYKLSREPLKEKLNTGAAQAQITIDNLSSYKIWIPDLITQRSIVQIISKYDYLIENNKRRIELLEESARQLYKEWFVRFRFPGHEHVKIIDGVPEGWSFLELTEAVAIVKDTVDPKNIPEETPYLGLEHLPRRSFTLNNWGSAGKVTSMKYAFQTGDILFGKIRPYFHKVGFSLVDGITSSDAIVMRPRLKKYYFIVLSEVSSDQFVALASKTVREGSKMPRADWDVLKKRVILEPPQKTLDVFNNQLESILSQCKLLSFQMANLAKARDLLLPKLMSGEIAV